MTDPANASPARKLAAELEPVEFPHEMALILLARVLNKPKTWILAHPETHLTASQQSQLDDLAARLKAGEPLAYLLGEQEFFGLPFMVTPDVLIPRPETEILVQLALDWLTSHDQATEALDAGTGSGCIACSLAVRWPGLRIQAVDISSNALDVARRNAERHHVSGQICFTLSDLVPDVEKGFDLVCANLPYIPSHKLREVNSLGYEPRLALDGGADGLDLIRRLLGVLPPKLKPKSLILLETESSLGPQTVELAQAAFPSAVIVLHQDLAGLDRVVSIQTGVK